MNRLLFALGLLLFVLTHTSAKEPPARLQLLSPQETVALLQEYEDDAVVLGQGDEAVYAFIDPLCPRSQAYLEDIYRRKERMFCNYTYYLFLYKLDRYDSEKLIATILASDYPELALKTVMVSQQEIVLEEADPDMLEQMQRIKTAAQRVGVYKRPYILAKGRMIGE